MPSRSIYQQSGFNPVSPLPFARAKEQRVQGKQARRDVLQQQDKQEKERDKQMAEEQKRLEQIAQGFGMSKGKAASMSSGELAGYVEVEAMRIAQNKQKLELQQQRNKVEQMLARQKKQKNLEAKIDRENKLVGLDPRAFAKATGAKSLGSAAAAQRRLQARSDTFLHQMRKHGLDLPQETVSKVVADNLEARRVQEAREKVFGGKGYAIETDPSGIDVFKTLDEKGQTKAYPAYRPGMGGQQPQPFDIDAQGKSFRIGSTLYVKDPSSPGGLTKVGSANDQTAPANFLRRQDVDEINARANKYTKRMEEIAKSSNYQRGDHRARAEYDRLERERKFAWGQLVGAKTSRVATPPQAQQPAARGLPPLPVGQQTQDESTPDKPYFMEPHSSGQYYMAGIDRKAVKAADPADNDGDGQPDVVMRWFQEMWAAGYFGDPNQADMAKAFQWARYNLNLRLQAKGTPPPGQGQQPAAPVR